MLNLTSTLHRVIQNLLYICKNMDIFLMMNVLCTAYNSYGGGFDPRVFKPTLS
jgi:hypothetical protein